MERFDLKKREQDSEDADEKNAHLKVWRTKRTEVNNNNNDDDGNAKLFHRSGFGDPYLEEKESLKEIHDRKRRSKGTPSDDKCYANEARNEDKNGVGKGGNEKNLLEISRAGNDVRASTFEKMESNDLRGVDAFRMESKLTSDAGEKGAESKGGAREARKDEGKNAGKNVVGGNYQQSGLSQGKSMGMEGKLTKEGKENLGEGNSLHSSESMTNELPGGVAAAAPAAAAAAASVSSSASSSPSSASLMSENPSSSQDKKEVARGAKEQEKSAAEQGKRSADESGNVNLHLESENKNLIQYSNENMKEGKRQAPFMLDMFNVKKTLLEKEDKPGKSISTIFNMKLAKAEVDTAAVKDCAKRGGNEKEVEIPITNGVLEFEKNKVKEVPYEDGTAGLALPSDIMERNVDEKRLKNSAREFDKRQSGQSAMNEEGIRNWFEAADRERVDANANQANIAEKRNGNVENGGKGGKFKNEEECLNDNADNNNNLVDGKNRGNVGKEKELNLIGSKNQESEVGGKEKAATNEVDGERKRKKKYQGGGFVAGNELNDQMTSDRYGQRKILQYMEYSNDEVEEADLNYNDREEEENQRQSVNAGKRGRVQRERERE